MHVCHVSDFIGGGAKMACVRLMSSLEKKHYKQTLLTPKNVKTILPTKLKYVFPFDPLGFFHSLFLFRKLKPDLIHLHNFKLFTFSIVLSARLLGIPIVFSVYDYFIFCSFSIPFKREGVMGVLVSAIDPIRKLLIKPFINIIDSFIALSENSKKILIKDGVPAEKIYKIPLIFDPSQIVRVKSNPKNIILQIGWLVPWKGFKLAVDALPKVLEEFDVTLVHIGPWVDENYLKEVKSLIKNKHLEPKVKLLGKAPYEEVKGWYSKAKMVLVLEIWQNMSPYALLESMLSGKTIVASKIGGIPEILGGTGILFDPESDELAEKIIFALKHSNEFGKKARKRALNIFDEKKNVNKIEKLYKHLS